jgi:integrase
MAPQRDGQRPRGTGSLYTRRDKAGRETWYAKFYVGDRRVKRKIGLRRVPGEAQGLTKPQAERKLRGLMDSVTPSERHERATLEVAGQRLVENRRALGRKPATIEAYETALRVHLVPFFVGRSLETIDPPMIRAFIGAKASEGLRPKSIRNYVSVLHLTFEFAIENEWASSNPCSRVEMPDLQEDPDIHFLVPEEIEALVRGVPDDVLGPVESALYLAAAMTGLRQGELIALRWRDVDFPTARIRVRRTYGRGEYGRPKTKASGRSVPMSNRVGAALDSLSQASHWTTDDDLVFAHPLTGRPLDRSKVTKRFKQALDRAGVRRVRFHDLRHTFGTRMAAAGVPMRTIQHWMGHARASTTEIYADYAPSEHEAEWVNAAFARAEPYGLVTGPAPVT